VIGRGHRVSRHRHDSVGTPTPNKKTDRAPLLVPPSHRALRRQVDRTRGPTRATPTRCPRSNASTGWSPRTRRCSCLFWATQGPRTRQARRTRTYRKLFHAACSASRTPGHDPDPNLRRSRKGTDNRRTQGHPRNPPQNSILGGAWLRQRAAAQTNATAAQTPAKSVKAATHFGQHNPGP